MHIGQLRDLFMIENNFGFIAKGYNLSYKSIWAVVKESYTLESEDLGSSLSFAAS